MRAAVATAMKVLFVGLAASGAVSLPKTSHALCAANPVDGVWQNIDSNTRSIVKVEYRTNCNDVRLCDQNGNCQPSASSIGKIRVFGSCHPSACNWGWTSVYRKPEGLMGYYQQGFADKWVWARLQNNQLTVVTRVKFKDKSGRPDYETRDFFRKVAN